MRIMKITAKFTSKHLARVGVTLVLSSMALVNYVDVVVAPSTLPESSIALADIDF